MKNFFQRFARTVRNVPSKAKTRNLILDRLEERALFDAAAMISGGDLDSMDVLNPVDPLTPVHGMETGSVESALVHPSVTPADSATEVAFIDAGVPNASLLVDDLRSAGIDVHLLDADSDGLLQIADIISEYDNLGAVHIVSHGLQGELLLGNCLLYTSDAADE